MKKENEAIATRFLVADEEKRGTKILLVEDDPINQKLVVKLLNKLGFTIDVVDNGQEAIRALSTREYKLVLMDIQMPVMDGIEATRQIRNNSNSGVLNPDVPIIALTAFTRNGGEKQCLEAGMNDYIPKPINYQKFVHTIENHLKLN